MNPTDLLTPRLRLCPPRAEQAEAVAAFLARNTAHFEPWDPPRPEGLATAAYQRDSLPRQAEAFEQGSCYRWYVEPLQQPGTVIGKLEVSGVSRGPHQSAFFGFAIDHAHEGQGLMREAAEAVIAAAFGPGIQLHRLQAAHQPQNRRSAGLLQRLGFTPIGLARGYLFIHGEWRDHQLVELLNPAFSW
ncbi:GNAT family N-acetyltransferase [Inhella proteolytica]|uniref:GNAT family N-acetyltransferase n=1 Tax=Inhella proteolytica TaxID=2795029 RepID=A0A931J3T0_9BURK|nr:GNAT family N-acetyltransferase [Inhella proteolytica]MBH9577228.1 GNAT family N-acetyltransferase [Inhella proteolytica]